MLFLPKNNKPTLALLLDGFNSNLLLEFISYSGDKCSSDIIIDRLYHRHPVLKIAMTKFIENNDSIAVIIIGSGFMVDKSKLEYIESNRDLILKDILLLDDNIPLFAMGKLALYSVSKSKDILKQAGKSRMLTLKVDKHVKKYKVIPNYSINYLKFNKNVVPNFYNVFNNVYNELHNVGKDIIPTTVVLEEDVELIINNIINNKSIKHIYSDIETEDLSMSAKVLCMSLDWDTNKDNALCIPIYNENIKLYLKGLLKCKPVIGHNFKFDIARLVHSGFVNFGDVTIKSDTLALANLVYSKSLGGLKLKHLCKTIFGNNNEWDEELEDYKKKHKITNYDDIPKPLLYKYAALDAYYTKLLYNKLLTFKDKIDKSKILIGNLIEVMIMLSRWEEQGIKIDMELLDIVHNLITPSITEAYNNILNINEVKLFKDNEGKQLNINSGKQLSLIATEYFHMSVKAKTKSGAISFAYDSLVALQALYSRLYKKNAFKYGSIILFVNSLLKYKQLIKFNTSYVATIKKRTTNGIFGVTYNSTGTLTGRVSSFFHTLPSKSELGRNFKRMVIPHNKDWLMVTGDFSQAEPRVMSSLSEDPLLIQSYKDNKDLYRYMASEVFNTDYNKITSEQRNIMKVVVLAISYGMGDRSLAAKLDIGLKEASSIRRGFYSKFNVLDDWRKQQIEKVKRDKYVETPLGRIIPILLQDTYKIEKVAVNYLIQSTTGEMCLIAFAKFSNILRHSKMSSFSSGSVQDSIEIENKVTEFIKLTTMMHNYFDNIVWKLFTFLKVPMKMDLEVGSTWGGSLSLKKTAFSTYILSGLNYDYNNVKNIFSKYLKVESKILSSDSVIPDEYSIYRDKLDLANITAQLKFI